MSVYTKYISTVFDKTTDMGRSLSKFILLEISRCEHVSLERLVLISTIDFKII
jgi:hypothetical protein